MSKDRIIELLTDEEIGCVLSGLRLLGRQYINEEHEEGVRLTESIYGKIESSYEMGVITNERI